MKKWRWKNWKRRLSLMISLVMVVTTCQMYPVKAAAGAYSNDFEDSAGSFRSFGNAKVQLSNAGDKGSGTEKDNSNDTLLTTKVTMQMEKDGYTDAFVKLKSFLKKTTKEYISSNDSFQVVLSVDKAESLAGKTASVKLFYQPNTTWSWCSTDEIGITAGKDYTITLPTSAINWGTGDTDTGEFGVQLVNFKEGMEVNVNIKSVEMIGKTSSLAAEVKSGEATLKYESQWDITSANISLTSFLSAKSKEDISKAKSIEAVISVDKAENFTDAKTPIAKLYFMPNVTWNWAVGDDVAVKAGEDIKVSIPISNIKWGDGDTAVGDCGIQLNNFKEGTVKYTVKSFQLVTESKESNNQTGETGNTKNIGKAKSGNGFLYVSERKNVVSGACADLSDYMKAGKTYEITAWVRNIGEGTDFIKLNWGRDAAGCGKTIGAVKANQDRWFKMNAVLAVPKSAKKVFINFTTKNTTNDFGIDEIVINEVKKGTTTKISNYTVTDKDVKDHKVVLDQMTLNNLTIDASVNAKIILNNVTVIGDLTYYDSSVTGMELNNSTVNQLIVKKADVKSSAIRSLDVSAGIPTIMLGSGSSIVRFLAGDDVILTRDEQSVVENVTVQPGSGNAVQITLKNLKCNLVIEANETSPVNVVLDNSQLENVSVSTIISGGEVSFTGNDASGIAALNLDDSRGVTATLGVPVQKLNISSSNVNVKISSKVNSAAVTGNGSNITLEQGGSTETMTIDGNNAKIVSKGNLGSLLINGNDADAAVTSETKVEIKKGALGADIEGTTNIIDNNPKSVVYIPAPTPAVQKATENKILKQNVSLNLTALKDPSYDDANVLVDLKSYFNGYLSKSALDKYEKIEIKLTVDKVTDYSAANKGKVTVYTLTYPNWQWAEYNQPELTANQEITITVDTSSILFNGDKDLGGIGLKFSQYAPNTAFTCSIASVKLIASGTSQDEQTTNTGKAAQDLVISSTAQTGSSLIEDKGWSGVGDIGITQYLTDESKLKSTIDKYDYLEVKVSFDSGTAMAGATPNVKIYAMDATDWQWADGGDTAIVMNGTTTVRLPVTSFKWGLSGSSTALGAVGMQIYNYEAGQTINYTIESIKLIAPGSTGGSTTANCIAVTAVSGSAVSLASQNDASVGSANVSIKELLTSEQLTKAFISQYSTIEVKFTVNGIDANMYPGGCLYVQNDDKYTWCAGAWTNISSGTVTYTIATSTIVWDSSTQVGNIGFQLYGFPVGITLNYQIESITFIK